VALVIAGSFSQTYLRNAFNNGFLCIEVPEMVQRLREEFAAHIEAKERTVVPGEDVEIDFTTGLITWRGGQFHFPPLGPVPQSLVAAGGVEKLVAKRLEL
jgi:homoaconitate hydratase